MKKLNKKWANGQKKWAFGHFLEKKWAEKNDENGIKML